MNYLSKDNVDEVLSLSPLQDDLLQGESSPDGARRHVVQATYALAGPLDAARLQRAWDHVVALHPALRVVFRTMRNRTVQVVLKTRPIPLDVHDLCSQGHDDWQATVEGIARAQQKPFDPAEGPLMRLALCRTADDRTVLIWTYHELILDERSRDLVLAELWATYDALTRGEPLPQTGRRPYREYLAWLAQQDWTPSREFWTGLLAGFEAATPFTLDDGAAASGDQQGDEQEAVRTITLPEDVSQALAALTAGHGVTAGTVMQGAWAILLGAYGNEDDVVFGLTCHGRPAALDGAGEIVGRFANVLPARLRIDGTQSLAAFLRDAHSRSVDLAAHAHTPLPEIKGYCGIAADQTIYDTLLTLHEEAAGATVDARRAELSGVSAERAYRLMVDVTPGRRWTIALTSAVLAGATLDRMLAHTRTLLESMVAQPEARLADLAMLPPAERRTLLVDFNPGEPGGPLDRLAHQVVESWAAQQPDAVAAVCGADGITYRELNARANRIAHWLRGQGFGRDDLAALLAERGIDMLAAILGVFKAGGAYVPLDAAYPDARLVHLLESSEARVILTQDRLAQRALDIARRLASPPPVLSLDESPAYDGLDDATALCALPGDNLAPVNEPSDLAYVFYTSGSTGQPKGVMVEHVGMLNHLWAKVRLLGLDQDSVVIQNASHCFDISVWQFLAPLMAGGRVVICDNDVAADPHALLSVVAESRATVLEGAPTLLEMLLDAMGDEVDGTGGRLAQRAPQLRHVISTAEALPVALCRKWLRACPHAALVNAYGPTECSDDTTHEVITASSSPPEGQAYMPVGRATPNFNVYILDRWGRPAPLGCVGEICFTGVGVGRGYLHDPERTAQAFARNPFDDGRGERMYRTGDLGRFLPDGRLVYLGRMDYQVKVRGRRIELGEIEAALARHPAVKQCVAIVRPDAHGQSRILAYVVLDGASDTEVAALRSFLQTALPAYMIPEHIVSLDALPLNRNGKVDRKALPDADEPARTDAAASAPRDEIEAGLAEIWQEVLDLRAVGIDDSFFDLGGHSLKTVQVRSRVQQRFGVDLALRAFFERQTIRELAPAIAGLRPGTITTIAPGDATIQRRPAADYYPMTHAQQRLWVLQQLDPHNCFYNLPSVLEFTGPLEVAALRRAFDTVVERQTGLRTTFITVEGLVAQRVAARLGWSCPLDDLSGLDADAADRALAEIVRVDAGTSFDLETGPLFRMRLVRMAADRHVLVFNIHHIISDAWSAQALGRELAALYHAFSRRLPNPLPPLAIQYTDYAYWQNERLAGDDMKDAERYWLDQLAGPLPLLNLPLDHPRPAVQTYAGHSQELALDARLLDGINRLGQRSDATLFMVLLAAVTTVLSRLSGQEDIIVGTPVAGRDHMALEDLIGFFVNTLPLRIDASGDPTFLDLLDRVKQAALDAYTYQEYPFDQMVQRVNPARDLSQSPIFSVMFQVNRAVPPMAIDGVTVRAHPEPAEHARFDLSITFIEEDAGLRCCLDYNTDLFEATTIDRVLQQMRTLLDGVIAAPQRRLWQLPLLPEPERRQVLRDWNETRAAYPRDRCLHHLFEEQAERTPEAVAVVDAQTRLTYRELNQRANQIAWRLCALGVGPEALVGICTDRSAEMLVGLLGILKAGAAYLPLDPAYPAERLSFMLADAHAPALLTQRRLADALPAHGARTVYLDAGEAALAAQSAENPDGGAAPANLAYVIYTSGSTGRPKGVQVTHRNVVNFLHSMRQRPGLAAEDTLLAVTSLSFDIAALELFLPLTAGARVVLVDRAVAVDGQRLREQVDGSGATLMQATPATWRLLLAAGWRNDGRVRMLCGGEALPVDLATELLSGDAPLWNMYGPTETTIWSSTYPVTSAGAGTGPIPIGRPIANTQLYVLDRRLQPAPIGVPGELYIGGDGIARGYANRPDLTAERFVPDPFGAAPGARLYRTGDLARYRTDGNVDYLGRLDHQVKVRGFRIELGEIEAVLAQHPAVRQAVALAREDTPGDTRLVAYVAPRAGQAPDESALRSYLAERLPSYMAPSTVVLLDDLPLTLNGKVDRKALPAPRDTQHAHQDGGDVRVDPRDLVELAMTKLWEDVLRVRPIGVFDDFFALGGHSLTAVALMNAVRERFAADLPLSLLFQAPTIAHLCAHLRAHATAPTGSVITIQKGSAGRPLFLVHPQGGGVLCYLHLARGLDMEMPVYGLEAVGYDGDEPLLTTVAAMADRYVQEIRRIAPQGPYHLAGWSFGGLVAVEIARRLEAHGEWVDFLGLIDTQAPGHDGADDGNGEDPRAEEQALLDIAVHQLGMDRSEFAGLSTEQGFDLVLQRAKELHVLPAEALAGTMQRRVRIMMVNQVAMNTYRCAAPIGSDLYLFRAVETDPATPRALVDATAWHRHTTGVVHDRPVPGGHHTLVNPPHVAAVAEAMDTALARVRAQVGARVDPARYCEREAS